MNQFNRIFRVLWSKTKVQWVVTSELEGAGSKKRGKDPVSMFCAALLIASMVGLKAEEAFALTGTGGASSICVGTTATNTAVLAVPSTCTATATDSLTNTSSGTIEDNTSILPPTVITVDAGGTGVSIDNSGLMKSLRGRVIEVNAAARGTSIINQVGGVISKVGRFRNYLVLFNTDSFDAGSSLINHGTIQVNNNSSTAIAIGIIGNMAGTLTNSNTGIISAQCKSSATITVNGISITGDLSGLLDNSGTISAKGTETSNSSTPIAKGIVAGSLSGTLTNSGSISGSMSTSSTAVQAYAFGIDVIGTASGSLVNTNTGVITANAIAHNSTRRAAATGVHIGTLVANSFTNNHRITAMANQTKVSATAYGVHLGSLGGVASNTGFISANATGNLTKENAEGFRIASMSTGGVFNNSGSVSSVVSSPSNIQKAYSLHLLAATGGNVNNQAGGILKGNISTPAGLTLFDNAGTIDIPDGVTTATIAGSYTQQSGGKLTIGASSAISYAKLTTGPANLLAGSVIDVYTTLGNTLAAGDTLTGVFTSSALTAGAITVTDNSSTLDFTATVNGNAIDLKVIVADTTAPVITLIGANPLSIVQGSTFTDLGSAVTDNRDTGLTATVSGTVDTTTVGTYTLTYNVTDAAGNAATPVIRTVIVTAAPTSGGSSTGSSTGGSAGCITPNSGLLPTLITMLVGLSLSRKRKK